MSIALDHIQALIDHPHTLRAHCNRCRHHTALDLQKLGERLGFDHSTLHDDLVPKLRCEKCGGKDIGLTLSHGTEKDRPNPFKNNANSRWAT